VKGEIKIFFDYRARSIAIVSSRVVRLSVRDVDVPWSNRLGDYRSSEKKFGLAAVDFAKPPAKKTA